MMSKAEVVLPQATRDRIEALINHWKSTQMGGIHMAARLLGVSYATLRVARLGGAVTAGTLALLEKKIAERDQQGKCP